jgi:predicted metal-binding membrane protein
MTPAGRERAQVRVPLLIVSAAGWLLLVSTPGATHDHHASAGLSRLAFGWFLMVAAMMAPLLAEPVRHIRDRSLAWQRARSIALFVAGYAIVWMAAGAVLQAVAMRGLAVESWMTMLVFACVAAVWQCSPLKQQCLNRGHAHPELAPGGRDATAGALRFGLTHGIWCVGSCWALMLLPLLVTRRHTAAMMLAFLWIAAERLERPTARTWRLRAPDKAVRLVFTRLTSTMPSRSAIVANVSS